MRHSEHREHVLAATESTLRTFGLRPRPQVNMFADDDSFTGVVLAPDPAEVPAADAMTLLGLVASTLLAARVFVLWDNQDLPTLPASAGQGETVLLVLEAGQDGMWLSAHPYRAEPGPPGQHGLPTVTPHWRPPMDVSLERLPGPVSEFVAEWQELPITDIASVSERLSQHGFVVTLTDDAGRPAAEFPDTPTSSDAADALGAAIRAGDLPSADAAVDVARRALAGAPPDDGTPRAKCLSVLSDILSFRYQLLGGRADRREALTAARAALAALPHDSTQRHGFLTTLSGALRVEYEATGDLDALYESLRTARESLVASPPGDPDRTLLLVNHSTAAHLWYQATGDDEALDEAVAHGREAVASVRRDSPFYATVLGSHSANLQFAFERDGDPAVLDEAIDAIQKAVHWTADTDWSKGGRLANLSLLLALRFRHTGELRALDDAITTARQAVTLCPPGDPDAGVYLSALATPLHQRYQRLGDLADLDEAIETHREAVRRTPKGHASRPMFTGNMATGLVVRYHATGDRADLDEAITAARLGVTELPADSPARGPMLSNLGNWLALRYDHTGDIQDLDAAIVNAEAAHESSAPEHPNHATLSINLALTLCRRDPDGVPNRALTLLEHAAKHPTAKVSERVRAGMEWSHRAKSAGLADSAARAFAVAVGLLPQLAPLASQRADSEHWLATYSGLAGDAAACALDVGRPDQAVELLEQGRAVLLSHALGTRSDLSMLREHRPDLARRFEFLCTMLEQDAADSLGADRHRAAADDLTKVVTEVRRVPGLDRFLLPPRASDLIEVAAAGPIVVVNTSEYRCDALIVTADGVDVCPLPRLSTIEITSRLHELLAALGDTASPPLEIRRAAERDIQGVLTWLWTAVAEPVLNKLGSPARVWWVPTGLLGFFPLHAAADLGTPGASALDRTVSSYSPSIGALGHARKGPHKGPARMLVVAMPHTPDSTPLPAARREARAVTSRFPDSDLLVGDQATREAVTSRLQHNTWTHFACHGQTSPESPSDGRLLLHDHRDRPLNTRAVSNLRLTGARFAFLSACQTATSSTDLPDESIHIASAFHLAGFAHVIGTLWSINDATAVALSEQFYDSISADSGSTKHVAAALHQAVLAIRTMSPDMPSRWASHIHIGP